ncbi:LOW QUALITY PROTEIN: inositol 1,4,5-trisphosphate receptor-interacting protein-like 1 [Pterocles gutturalis]
MAVVVFLTISVLGIVQNPLQLVDELDRMHSFIQHHVEQPSWKMTQLIEDIEQNQEKNEMAREALLLAVFQKLWFWTSALVAGALIMLLWLCWRTRKRSSKPESSCKHGSPRSQEKEEDEKEEEEDDYGVICDTGKFLVNGIQWPVQYMADRLKLVEDLVDELFSACKRFSRSNFKPRLQPAIGMGCVYEGWSVWEDNVPYHLLVALLSPGHAFCLELGTAEEMLNNDSGLHVQLQSKYMREQLVGDILHFLPHHKDELKSQDPSLLNTLCISSEIKNTACWFRMFVKDTWKVMPLSHCCQLTVLPTTCS